MNSWLKTIAWWLSGVVVLVIMTLTFTSVTTRASGEVGGLIDRIQAGAWWQWGMVSIGMPLGLLLIVLAIMFWKNYQIVRRDVSPVPPEPAKPRPVPPKPVGPVAPQHWVRILLLTNVLFLILAVYNGAYFEYRHARAELDILLPVCEERVAILQRAKEREEKAKQQWQQASDTYWLLMAKEDAEAKKLVTTVAQKMKDVIEARIEREYEERVVEQVQHDVALYKRLVRHSPWRILTDFTDG